MQKNHTYDGRKYVVILTAVFIVLVYIIRLFYLQIASNDYKRNADSNAFLERKLYPARGNIYDRHGDLIVFNQPTYDILFVPLEIGGMDTLDFCATIGISKEDFDKRMSRVKNRRYNPGYSAYTQQTFMTQVSPEEAARLQEKLFKFNGFYIQRRTMRQYTHDVAAHILGDIGEISPAQLEADTARYYVAGDYVGKQGVEKEYEEALRGVKGVEILLRDAKGRIQGRYMDGTCDVAAVPGKNITLGLDLKLQQLGEKLLQGKMGSIVAIEPATGEILCLVSSPTYSPTLLVGRQRGQNHAKLQKDPAKPLFNRAIMAAYPPGSTFKPVQGLVMLQEGIITPETTFPCYNGFVIPGMRVGCHAHPSPLKYQDALSTSCNSFFCWGLWRMLENKKYGGIKNAITVWKDYMVAMGFGYKLGVDLPGEKRGLIPNYEYYSKALGKRWRALNVISIAIGQGEILATPLQIANEAATIANRGRFITPHVVKSVEGEKKDERFTQWRYTGIDKEYYDIAVRGMRGAVVGSAYGATCRRANIPGIEVCGKTGTAQNRGTDHSIFMGFAPMDNSRIAIAVYVENGGFGATWAVPIGALMIEQYVNGSIAPERSYLIDEISNTNLMPYEFRIQKK